MVCTAHAQSRASRRLSLVCDTRSRTADAAPDRPVWNLAVAACVRLPACLRMEPQCWHRHRVGNAALSRAQGLPRSSVRPTQPAHARADPSRHSIGPGPSRSRPGSSRPFLAEPKLARMQRPVIPPKTGVAVRLTERAGLVRFATQARRYAATCQRHPSPSRNCTL